MGSHPGASCSRSLHVRAGRPAALRAAGMAEARRTHTPHAPSKFTLRTRCQRTPSQLAPLPVDTAAHTSSRAGRGPAARQTRPASQGRFHPVPLFQSCTLFTSRGRQRRTHGTSPARPAVSLALRQAPRAAADTTATRAHSSPHTKATHRPSRPAFTRGLHAGGTRLRLARALDPASPAARATWRARHAAAAPRGAPAGAPAAPRAGARPGPRPRL